MPREFDEHALLDRIDADIEFLEETVDMLEEDCPPLLEQIRDAAASKNASALAKSAHALKGMFSNFCAGPAETLARELEMRGREDHLADVGATLQSLEFETVELQSALRDFVRTQSS